MLSLIFRSFCATAILSSALVLGLGFASIGALLSGSVIVGAAILTPWTATGLLFALLELGG